jgi:hypothetical protein
MRRVAWFVIVALLGACRGDNPPGDAAADVVIDARVDAPTGPPPRPECSTQSQCGAQWCCLLICSPGGACYPPECTTTPCENANICDPGSTACIKPSGASGTCTQRFPSGYWVCG